MYYRCHSFLNNNFPYVPVTSKKNDVIAFKCMDSVELRGTQNKRKFQNKKIRVHSGIIITNNHPFTTLPAYRYELLGMKVLKQDIHST